MKVNKFINAFCYQHFCFKMSVHCAEIYITLHLHALHINHRVVMILVTDQASSICDFRPNTNYTVQMHSLLIASVQMRKEKKKKTIQNPHRNDNLEMYPASIKSWRTWKQKNKTLLIHIHKQGT